MFRELMRAKIHRAVVTDANLAYVGSLSVDSDLLAAADIHEYEKISVVNINTGGRFETYAIAAPAGSGTIALNGGAARLGQPGDLVIIIAYGYYQDQDEHQARVVFVDELNAIVSVDTQSRGETDQLRLAGIPAQLY
ncbi:MAG: Aspartate 1-decarboxylase [bacterium]|nr:Aspartate 1-decarboxylase [bacterium]